MRHPCPTPNPTISPPEPALPPRRPTKRSTARHAPPFAAALNPMRTSATPLLLVAAASAGVALAFGPASSSTKNAVRLPTAAAPVASPPRSSALFRTEGVIGRRYRQRRTDASPTELAASAFAAGAAPSNDGFNPGPEITFGSSGLKLNLFGFVYGLFAITTGIVWWASMTLCQLIYFLTGNRADKFRKWPVTLSHLWGTNLLRWMGCFPKITGKENLKEVNKRGTPVMFVANHCSWMDIPFVGVSIGWRNYKIVAKQELLKVPILSKSLRTGGNVILDRTDRRSQLETFKRGVSYLKDGVNLVTFAEGTRSRDGRLKEFKKGAFKMAQKAGVPIVPVSVRGAHLVQPIEYVFPVRPSFRVGGGVHIGEMIETEGKTDEELMEQVRGALIEGLPEEQRPL